MPGKFKIRGGWLDCFYELTWLSLLSPLLLLLLFLLSDGLWLDADDGSGLQNGAWCRLIVGRTRGIARPRHVGNGEWRASGGGCLTGIVLQFGAVAILTVGEEGR